MLIDMGADDREEAQKRIGIRPGQQILRFVLGLPMANGSEDCFRERGIINTVADFKLNFSKEIGGENFPNTLFVRSKHPEEEVGFTWCSNCGKHD